MLNQTLKKNNNNKKKKSMELNFKKIEFQNAAIGI